MFTWIELSQPTHMVQSTRSFGGFLVSEQRGLLVELFGNPATGDGPSEVVLDIRNLVTGNATEEGFLGFALHPDFASNGRLFTYYSATGPRRSVVSEFNAGQDGIFDPATQRVILEVPQPQSNHNGGMLAFGPDGFLYISLGDGGGAGDRSNNAQDRANVLGSILRIDVDAPGVPYGIPSDNPFVGQSGRADEIWAYGFRNPWRFSFDPETGDLWAGDVGQDRHEEIDLVVRGGNYGWRLKEGPDCFLPASGCEVGGLVDPVISYTHASGCSVTGGYVYRAERIPSLAGAYVYGDFCSGIIWAMRSEGGEVTESVKLIDTSLQIPAFGQSADGEVYVLSSDGSIFRFVGS